MTSKIVINIWQESLGSFLSHVNFLCRMCWAMV